MSDASRGFVDPFRTFADHARDLNANCKEGSSPTVFYEIMSGSLIWSDELSPNMPIEVIWALRSIFAYRTGLILNKPRDEFQAIWDHARLLFPNWIGFLPQRSQPTPELLAIYRRGAVCARKGLRDLERKIERKAEEERKGAAGESP